MQTLKILTIAMAVMIVAGIVVLGVTIMHRLNPAAGSVGPAANTMLDEPSGTHIIAITGLQDRVAVLLQGGGPDRIVFLDAHTGRPLGHVEIAQ